jgi:hypothetical protein
MLKGFDTDRVMSDAFVRRAVAAGYGAAGRYLKNLTSSEIASCAKYGMRLWLIDEGAGDAAVFGRGVAGGQADGAAAKARAAVLNVPAGIPIYFAVDFDAGAADVDGVGRYLNGYVAACAPYRVGMYADGLIASAVPTEVGDYLPAASGWQGSKDYINSGKVALLQHVPEALLGLDADPVDVLDEGVLWLPGPDHIRTQPAGGVVTVPPAAPPASFAMPDLRVLQGFLGVAADGIWGPVTAAAVARYYERV